MNSLEKLVLTACQSSTNEGIWGHFLNEGKKNFQEQSLFLKEIVENAIKNYTSKEDKKIIDRSISIIQEAVENSNKSLFQSIQNILFTCLGRSTPHQNQQILTFLSTKLDKHAYPTPEGSHLESLAYFMSQFQSRFGKKPDAMKGAEIHDLFSLSERIWNSANVQLSNDKYQAYANLMEEDVIGSHLLIEEIPGQPTLLDTIKGKTQLETRQSTHYSNVDEDQSHIRGNLFSETLMHAGSVGIKNRQVVLQNRKATYWKNLTEPNRSEAKEMHVTWRQRESYPDGPDWVSWILHRTLDFGLYVYLKNYGCPTRPQVAKYKSIKKGRGVPDTNPVIIRHPQSMLTSLPAAIAG